MSFEYERLYNFDENFVNNENYDENDIGNENDTYDEDDNCADEEDSTDRTLPITSYFPSREILIKTNSNKNIIQKKKSKPGVSW
ncbi:3235_t:CDS:1, partial [Dentiscutata erythropus]